MKAERSTTVRDVREGDLAGIAQLQRHVEDGAGVSPALFAQVWPWLYRDNPMGPLAAYVAEDGSGRIVGHEGIMPFRVSHRGEELLGGISCNLVVAEEQRNTLLFARIVQRLQKSYAGAGFDFIYGPARPHIAHVLVRLGYRDLGDLPVYVRPVRFAPFVERFVTSPLARRLLAPFAAVAEKLFALVKPARRPRLETAEVEEITDDLGMFAEAASAQFQTYAMRTRPIMQWRYFALKHRGYRVFVCREEGAVVGYVSTRRMPMLAFDTLGIVDILFASGRYDVGKSLLRVVHDVAARDQVTALACMVGPESPLIPLLRRAGYMRSPEGFRMVLHERRTPGRFGAADLSGWYATWYDHDYV